MLVDASAGMLVASLHFSIRGYRYSLPLYRKAYLFQYFQFVQKILKLVITFQFTGKINVLQFRRSVKNRDIIPPGQGIQNLAQSLMTENKYAFMPTGIHLHIHLSDGQDIIDTTRLLAGVQDHLLVVCSYINSSGFQSGQNTFFSGISPK